MKTKAKNKSKEGTSGAVLKSCDERASDGRTSSLERSTEGGGRGDGNSGDWRYHRRSWFVFLASNLLKRSRQRKHDARQKNPQLGRGTGGTGGETRSRCCSEEHTHKVMELNC